MIIRTELIPVLLLISRNVVILSACQLLYQVSSNLDVWLTIFRVISQHGDNHHDHRKKFTSKDLYQIRCFLKSRILYNNTFALISTLTRTNAVRYGYHIEISAVFFSIRLPHSNCCETKCIWNNYTNIRRMKM